MEFEAEVSQGLATGALALLDITVSGVRVGKLAQTGLATGSRLVVLGDSAWLHATVHALEPIPFRRVRLNG